MSEYTPSQGVVEEKSEANRYMASEPHQYGLLKTCDFSQRFPE